MVSVYIEDNYHGIYRIESAQITDDKSIQLTEFRYKGDERIVNLLSEISDKIP